MNGGKWLERGKGNLYLTGRILFNGCTQQWWRRLTRFNRQLVLATERPTTASSNDDFILISLIHINVEAANADVRTWIPAVIARWLFNCGTIKETPTSLQDRQRRSEPLPWCFLCLATGTTSLLYQHSTGNRRNQRVHHKWSSARVCCDFFKMTSWI